VVEQLGHYLTSNFVIYKGPPALLRAVKLRRDGHVAKMWRDKECLRNLGEVPGKRLLRRPKRR
jgi:hypothetical protein